MKNRLRIPSLPALPGQMPALAKWGALCACCLLLIAFTAKRRQDRTIPDIKVEVRQAEGLHFVNEQEVFRLVESLLVQEIKRADGAQDLRLGRMEKILEKNPYVGSANVSQDLSGRLLVEIEQSRPIARILGVGSGDYYLSQEGRVIPVSPIYTARVMTLEGEGARRLITGLPTNDSGSVALFAFIKHIDANNFWRAQTASLEVDRAGEILIYPQIGTQIIEFGNSTNYEKKLRKLWAYYHQVVPAKGWSSYSFVSVKYANQIVCR